jgi:hypothetical protein
MPTPTDIDGVLELLVPKLWEVQGARSIGVLPGGRAGVGRSDAELELVIVYRDKQPLDVTALRTVLDDVNDTVGPTVTELGGWGPWMNGGAQLTIGSKRIDVLYRSADNYERVITQAKDGHAEHDWLQLPPYGFPSVAYLGEVDTANPILDPREELHDLKEAVRPYPTRLKANLITGFLWGAEHTLKTIGLSAERNDIYAALGGLTRASAMLCFAIYAMNERYYISDRGALDQMATFAITPPHCHARIHDALRDPHLSGAVEQLGLLLSETRQLARPLLR